MKVLQESDDEELSSLVFETLSPLMTDGESVDSMTPQSIHCFLVIFTVM